jgi:hypothetical protein
MLLTVSLVIDSHGSIRTVMTDPRVMEALKEKWTFKPTVLDGSNYRQWKEDFEADLQSRGADWLTSVDSVTGDKVFKSEHWQLS